MCKLESKDLRTWQGFFGAFTPDIDKATTPSYAASTHVASLILFIFACQHISLFLTRHNTGWDIKIFCFVALLVGMTFAPNPVFDDNGFIWVARIGAFVFLILQQVILIDSAYCVNEYVFPE